MKIIIIRHEKVDMVWPKRCDAALYDSATRDYDICPVIPDKREPVPAIGTAAVYISALPRTYETACKLFGERAFIKTPLLNEVPMRSFRDTKTVYPLWVWNMMGRIQWFLLKERQPETKADTVFRAREMVRLLEEKGEDCYIVSHGFFMRILLWELKKHGFQVKRPRRFAIGNLDQVIAVK